jgi:hypothetical protein
MQEPDQQDVWEESAWAELPEPEVLAPHVMLDEFEVVNVLGGFHKRVQRWLISIAPLVRCSKRKSDCDIYVLLLTTQFLSATYARCMRLMSVLI